MELEHLWSTIFILVSLSYTFFQLTKQRKPPENPAKLPPGPPKLPIIGHLHLFSGGGLPQHVLGRVSQKYGPVAHVQLGEMYSVVISSREAAKQVLQTTDPAFADRGDRIATRILWYDRKDLAFCPYGAHWRQMRRICVSELLSAPNIRAFGLVRQDEMSSLVLFLRSRSTASFPKAVDLAEEISRMTMSVICRAATGSVVKDRDALIGLVKAAASMASGLEVADLFPSSRLLNLLSWNKYRLWRMRRRLDPILEGIVEEHRVKKSGGDEFGGEDIIDVMLRMQKDSQLQVPITTDAIKAFLFDLFTAGAESTSSTATWAMAELMRNPEVMAKAQAEVREALKGKMSMDTSDIAELKYLRSVVKETLRLHPSIPLIMRQCREECEVNGYTIPVKSRVMINVRSLGRDPLYWEEPEIFRPERFDVVSRDFIGNDFEYIPFGAGRRICPGMNFGLANVEVPLAQLLYHFDWKLPEGMSPADVDMAESGGLTGPRKKPLFLVPTPYVPSTE